MCSQSWIHISHIIVMSQVRSSKRKAFFIWRALFPWMSHGPRCMVTLWNGATAFILKTHRLERKIFLDVWLFDVALFLSFCLIKPLPLGFLLFLQHTHTLLYLQRVPSKVWDNEEENEGGQMSRTWVYKPQWILLCWFRKAHTWTEHT